MELIGFTEDWLRTRAYWEEEHHEGPMQREIECAKANAAKHGKTFVVFQDLKGFGHMRLKDWNRHREADWQKLEHYVAVAKVYSRQKKVLYILTHKDIEQHG